MHELAIYLFLIATVFSMNVVPAFMPATWSVLALFYIKYDLAFVPVIIIGAAMASLGRMVLYFLSREFVPKIVPAKWLVNYHDLGKLLNVDRKVTIPLMVGYAFLPIPSNQVFIAAGLARADIKVIIISFFFGRLLSYSFWVAAAHRVASSLDDLFIGHFAGGAKLGAEIFSFSLIFIIGAIPWKKILNKIKKT